MAGRMITQKILFLDGEKYNIFIDFMFLINDLASNLDDTDIDELQEAFDYFTSKVTVKEEEEED